MTLINYKETNLAKWQLSAWISAANTTLNLKAWEWDLFPSVFPFIIKVEQYDNTSTLENKPVTKREIMRINNKVWDVLTVTRWFEACPANDTATTQTSTAFSFDADDYIYHVETAWTQKDLKDELIRLETDKLDITDYISWDKLFKDSSTGTDAYQVNIPEITSYAQIDWQAIRVRVDVWNTADATLEINSLWAKDIVKFKSDPLQTWDVKAGQIIFVVYNWDTDDFEIKDSIDQSSNVVVEKFMKEVQLWEDVDAWDWDWLVYFGRWQVETLYVEQTSWWEDVIVWNWVSIKAREKILILSVSEFANIMKEKWLSIKKNWNPTDNLTFSLYEDDWTTLIADLKKFTGWWLTTSFDFYNLLTDTAGLVTTDEIWDAESNPHAANNWDYWIKIAPTSNILLKWLKLSIIWAAVDVTLTIYNETTTTTIYTSTEINVDNDYDAIISNIILESWNEYSIYITYNFNSTIYPNRKTFTTWENFWNFSLEHWVNLWAEDNTYIYWIIWLTTQAVAWQSISEVVLSWYEWQDIYLMIERDWAQNASNYYILDWQNWWTQVETRDWANWNDATNNLKSQTQRWYLFTLDKVWKYDCRYDNTANADWIVIESWLTWETKKMVFSWDLTQTAVLVWEKYYWDTQKALVWSQTEISVSNSWVYYVTWQEYIEKVQYDLRNNTGWASNMTTKVYLNWVEISSLTTNVNARTTTNDIEQNLWVYLKYWDILETKVTSAIWNAQAISYFTQNYEFGRWKYTTLKPIEYKQLLIWKWDNNTTLQLMINENNSGVSMKNRIAISANTVYLAETDWFAIVNASQNCYWYTDNTDATTEVVRHTGNYSSDTNTLTFPVKAMNYYKMSNAWYFYPINNQ